MLGLGIGLDSSDFVGEAGDSQYVLHTERYSFASSTNNIVKDTSVVGNLTITAGQTAPGSSDDDWLKIEFDSNQTSNFSNGVRMVDVFNGNYDFSDGEWVALIVDIFLPTGFAGTDVNTPPVRGSMIVDTKQYFYTTSGLSQLSTNVVHEDFGAVNSTNDRYMQVDGASISEKFAITFNSSGDKPLAGDAFYIRDLRVIVASQDLEDDISEELFS